MATNLFEVKIFIPKKQDDLHYVYLYDKESKKIIQKYYKGINIYPEAEERLSAAEDLQKAILIKLKSGWLPKTKKNTLPQFIAEEILIIDALELSIESMYKRLEKKTVQCYACTSRFLIKEIKFQKWGKTYLSEYQNTHVEKLIEAVSNDRGWSNNEYNKNLVYVKAIFSELVRLKYIKVNPAHGLLSRKSEKRQGYTTLTDVEQTKVINHFQKHFPNFAVWLKTLYHTGMRPKELALVKCSMIDENLEYFNIPDSITKTDDNRRIPIVDDLKKDLLKFDLTNKDYFLFGKYKSRSANDRKNFQPNKYQLAMNTSNNIWREEVIHTLGINKKQYSNKHQKASHIILDGGSIESVQRAFGHSTSITTEIYAQILNVIQLNEFKEKSRDFK